MRRLSLACTNSLMISLLACSAAGLPRSTPESQGISSAGIRDYVETADRQVNTMHSFMLVRHGHVVAEAWWSPEAADKPHVLWSLSKSFTSTAVGLAVAEGKLSIDDPVLKFFPDSCPSEPAPNLKTMRVRDLLTMGCGHDVEPKRGDNEPWVDTFLKQPVPHEPGTHFLYNSLGTYMRAEGHQANPARLPATALVPAARDREPDVGLQPARN